ncbi:MAG: 4-hydroxythreonine-4-phosphate dehydrogenase PdxA [Bacteroidetes bacterium]|nr:4-hydroxythreonine-4-phosphate dehydrogenase PdxA [Bacteroidota bacterium]
MSGGKPNHNPRIILTTGDPNGIGPEIILKIFSDSKFISKFDLSVLGNKKIFDHYSQETSLKNIPPEKIIEMDLPSGFMVTPGKISSKAGKISGDSVLKAAHLCMRKEFDAMVTLPLSKESLNLGGFNYPGHTEMLKEITDSGEVVMILHSAKFSVALITGHIPVKKISGALTRGTIIKKLITINNSLVKDFGIRSPSIGMLSLNPHAGDGGMIGNEETDVIIPAMDELNSVGFRIRGPYSSDAYFANKSYRRFNITAAVYHDQGLIPFKMIAFDKGVNFTAGLKIIRTSPDHGTAFDIAGTGRADPQSTYEAIKLAAKLVKKK